MTTTADTTGVADEGVSPTQVAATTPMGYGSMRRKDAGHPRSGSTRRASKPCATSSVSSRKQRAGSCTRPFCAGVNSVRRLPSTLESTTSLPVRSMPGRNWR